MRGKRIANSIWKEKNKVRGLTLSDFKMHYKAIRIKTKWYQGNNKQLDKQNRIENPEIDPHKYSQLIFDKGAKTILVVQKVKNPSATRETQVQSLSQEDPLEKGMSTHPSILAWRIPWTEATVHGDRKELDTTERLTQRQHKEKVFSTELEQLYIHKQKKKKKWI